MWLLSTDRAELHYFHDPRQVTGGYAILSHVWDGHEQSFQEIRALEERCKTSGENPRDLASGKVRECCKLAESHGLRWIWDDTCCINKESSSELSEAINSMFRWYALSRICYAYLRDVPSQEDPHAPKSAFRKSRWHERGWTLQELIAPRSLYFVSLEWEVIDAKVELAGLLTEITGIPSDVLTGQGAYEGYSIAARMSWAARRKTTRIEDEAYSLMGIFNINMPTIYGEGRNAFRRLQEEILRKSPDTSIFVWGSMSRYDHRRSLFAESPEDFLDSGDIRYEPILLQRELPPGIHIPVFSVTSHGVLARISVAELDEGELEGLLMCSLNAVDSIALCLSPDPHSPDPQRPLCTVTGLQQVAFSVEDYYSRGSEAGSDNPVWSYREVYITSPPPLSEDSDFVLEEVTLPTRPRPLVSVLFTPIVPFLVSVAFYMSVQYVRR